MEPTSSIQQMFEIIDDENKVQSMSTEQIKEILYIIQLEKLSRIFSPVHRIIEPSSSKTDMEKIVRLEEALTSELQKREEHNQLK